MNSSGSNVNWVRLSNPIC